MTKRQAAFFRLEGALSPRPSVHAAAWLAGASQTLAQRLGRLSAVAVSTTVALGGDPTTAARLAWSALRGVSEDRLEVLGEEYFHEHLRNRIRPVGFDLVERAKLQGRRVVLLSDNLDVIVRHVADHMGADLWVANHLEVRNGRATGRLSDPVLTRPGGRWLREWADAHGLSLGQSCGYGSSESDAVLLSAIGLPCAIHPDRALRRMARDLDWPVVEA